MSLFEIEGEKLSPSHLFPFISPPVAYPEWSHATLDLDLDPRSPDLDPTRTPIMMGRDEGLGQAQNDP
jgi:hypothetical protein